MKQANSSSVQAGFLVIEGGVELALSARNPCSEMLSCEVRKYLLYFYLQETCFLDHKLFLEVRQRVSRINRKVNAWGVLCLRRREWGWGVN